MSVPCKWGPCFYCLSLFLGILEHYQGYQAHTINIHHRVECIIYEDFVFVYTSNYWSIWYSG
jgi:hypothetical protein